MANEGTTILYRPTGFEELELVKQSGYRAWPPRLPEQSIFYPVTNEEYAIQIARDWNVKESGKEFVTRFHVRSKFMSQLPVETARGSNHTEWWVPAERLEELSRNIVGAIGVIHEFGS